MPILPHAYSLTKETLYIFETLILTKPFQNFGRPSPLKVFCIFCDIEYLEVLNSFLTFFLKYNATDKKGNLIVENKPRNF